MKHERTHCATVKSPPRPPAHSPTVHESALANVLEADGLSVLANLSRNRQTEWPYSPQLSIQADEPSRSRDSLGPTTPWAPGSLDFSFLFDSTSLYPIYGTGQSLGCSDQTPSSPSTTAGILPPSGHASTSRMWPTINAPVPKFRRELYSLLPAHDEATGITDQTRSAILSVLNSSPVSFSCPLVTFVDKLTRITNYTVPCTRTFQRTRAVACIPELLPQRLLSTFQLYIPFHPSTHLCRITHQSLVTYRPMLHRCSLPGHEIFPRYLLHPRKTGPRSSSHAAISCGMFRRGRAE
jgi:hypothetical protein